MPSSESVSRSSSTRARAFTAGATYGAAAWLTYAVVEYGFAKLLVPFLRAHCGTARYGGTFGWELALGYPLIGAALGGLGTALWHRVAQRGVMSGAATAAAGRAIGVLTLVCLVVLPQGSGFGRTATGLLLCAIGGSAAAAAMAVLWRPSLFRNVQPLLSVWTIAFLTQGLLWLRVRHALFGDPVRVRYSLILGYVIAISAVAAGAALLRWRRQPAGDRDDSVWSLRVLAPSVAAFVCLVMAVTAMNGPLAGAHAVGSSAHRLPNVILIVMDTVRADHLSLYGYERETSPNLTELARDSVVYRHAFSSSDYTLPSLGSLFTGRLPTGHGAHTEDPRLNAGRVVGEMTLSKRMLTLPEILSSAGYRTAAVVANHGLLTPRYNLDQGFDLYVMPFPGCAPWSVSSVWQPWLARLVPSVPLWNRDAAFSSAAEVNREIYEVLGRVAPGARPFHLFVNYMDAHQPYEPPSPYDRRFPGKDPAYREQQYEQHRRAVLKRERPLPPRAREHLISQYDGGIALLDAQIGDLMDRLKAMGIYDDSLIVVTADHGESFGEHQLMGHNVSVYQEQIHVPLIVKYPGRHAGRVVVEPASTVDLMPTVLDLLQVPHPSGIDGQSLLSAAPAGRPIISESFPHPAIMDMHPRFHRIERAIIEWPYKLISSTNGHRELYRLDVDPLEQQELDGDRNPIAVRLAGRMDAWLDSAVAATGEAPSIDAETLERLRSLGYMR